MSIYTVHQWTPKAWCDRHYSSSQQSKALQLSQLASNSCCKRGSQQTTLNNYKLLDSDAPQEITQKAKWVIHKIVSNVPLTDCHAITTLKTTCSLRFPDIPKIHKEIILAGLSSLVMEWRLKKNSTSVDHIQAVSFGPPVLCSWHYGFHPQYWGNKISPPHPHPHSVSNLGCVFVTKTLLTKKAFRPSTELLQTETW